MRNPYEALPPSAFWRPAVADRAPLDIDDLWQPKFRLPTGMKVVTAGSCFAQHIGKALVKSGFELLEGEPAPRYLAPEKHAVHGYGVFSFRVGNIYTAALLRQWVSWALGAVAPSAEYWLEDGRFYDPFRPTIEPGGFASLRELMALRRATLGAIRGVLEKAELFIFTLGLTEGWKNLRTGEVYPLCPGATPGTSFNPAQHGFFNATYLDTCADLVAVVDMIKTINPRIRFLFTVSPVPLVATASWKHVLVATTYSKATLRAVAGDLAAQRSDVDYFPSYEIISSFPYGGMFYAKNKREVVAAGVEHVMRQFFGALGVAAPEEDAPPASAPPVAATPTPPPPQGGANDGDLVCEEILLEAFAGART